MKIKILRINRTVMGLKLAPTEEGNAAENICKEGRSR
jgi:hypothetical protein